MATEKQIQRYVLDALKKHAPTISAHRITDGGPGFPDLVLFQDVHFSLVELKVEQRRSALTKPLSTLYRKEQIAWFHGINAIIRPAPVFTLLYDGEEYHLWLMTPGLFKSDPRIDMIYEVASFYGCGSLREMVEHLKEHT